MDSRTGTEVAAIAAGVMTWVAVISAIYAVRQRKRVRHTSSGTAEHIPLAASDSTLGESDTEKEPCGEEERATLTGAV